MTNRANKKGFSIVEMLVVIGVLAVLMGIVTTAATSAISAARERRANAIKQIASNGIAAYRAQLDMWPPKNGQLNKWADDGIGSDSQNGVPSGRHVAFLSADQCDEMFQEIVKKSIRAGGAPLMDVNGMFVANRNAQINARTHGMEFKKAISLLKGGNKKEGTAMKLADMAFGYQDKDKNTFRRFFIQFNSDTETVTVMTKEDYVNWWNANCTDDNPDIKYPSGYEYLKQEKSK